MADLEKEQAEAWLRSLGDRFLGDGIGESLRASDLLAALSAPSNGAQLEVVTVPRDLLRRAQQAINWHLEPDSPDVHELTMKDLEAALAADPQPAEQATQQGAAQAVAWTRWWRRNGTRRAGGGLGWGEWQECSEAEAKRVTGLSSWQVRSQDYVPATPTPAEGGRDAARLTVWYGPMPESNGRTNWTAILHSGDMVDGVTLARSEYPDRVRYEADRVRYLLGDLPERPDILDYDGDRVTPCHLCGGTGERNGKPCHGLNFRGTFHSTPSDAATQVQQGGAA